MLRTLTIVALVLTGVLSGPGLFAQLSFKSYRNFSSNGDGSIAIMTADFNNDGIDDLAVANTFSNDISIMLGDGRGGFLAARRFPAGAGAFFVTAADFNGDGNLDLAVANFGQRDISVLLGDGSGQFSAPMNVPVADVNTGVVVADFNGDGILDIAAACFGPLPDTPDCSRPDYMGFTLTVLLGESAGPDVRFGPGRNIRSGCSPEGVYAADFNQDGRPDLVATNFLEFTIALFLGDERGEFALPPRVSAPGIMGPAYGAVADFDGDGNLDFVSANWFTHNVSVLLGDGQGNFRTPIRNFSTQSPPAFGRMPRSVVVEDFDNDGYLDLATSNGESNDVSILFGDGQGGFSAAKILPLEGRMTWFMTMGDFNKDGNRDFAVVRQDGLNTENVSIVTGDGWGNFGNFSRVTDAPVAVAAADFNRDGKLDLAIAAIESNEVWVRLGDGRGGFDYNEILAVGARPVALAAGDFNNDNHMDLATANFGSNDITVWLGDGQGRFSERRDFSVNGTRPNFLLAVDLNRDGRLDLVTANYDSNTVSVLLGDGRGGFILPARTFPVGGTNPWAVNVGDFDNDGRLDLATVNSGSNDISILRGDGMGGFANPVRLAAGSSPRALVVYDFNRDGKQDLAVLNAGSSDVTVLYGDGQGGFPDRFQLSLGVGRSGVYLSHEDLDGDGRMDLVVADFAYNQVHILRGDERGRFLPPISYFAGVGPTSVAIGDYNGDGKKDLALTDMTSHNLAVLMNNSRP